jgi:hypothetical protein
MHPTVSADSHGVKAPIRPLDALVVVLALSVVALCSWPAQRPSPAPVAWRLLPRDATP